MFLLHTSTKSSRTVFLRIVQIRISLMQTLPSILKAPLVGYAFKIQAGNKFAEIDGDSVSSFLISMYIHSSFINKIQDQRNTRLTSVWSFKAMCWMSIHWGPSFGRAGHLHAGRGLGFDVASRNGNLKPLQNWEAWRVKSQYYIGSLAQKHTQLCFTSPQLSR